MLAIAAVALWPETEEAVWIDTLASADMDEILQAADALAASGSTRALEPLHGARERLVETMVQRQKRDLVQFGHLEFDLMMRRIADRRQSPEAQRLWRTLAAVTRAIGILDGTAEAHRSRRDAQREEGDEAGERGETEEPEGTEEGEKGETEELQEPGRSEQAVDENRWKRLRE